MGVAVFGELGYTIVNSSAMPVYVKAIDLPLKWVAIVTASFLIMEGLLKSPFGVLSDKVGRKILILLGPLISVITSLITPHIENPYLLVGLRILDGIGAAALWPASFSLIGDYVPEKRRATAMSYFNLAYLLGVALGPLMGGTIDDFSKHHLHATDVTSKYYSFYLAAIFFALTSLVALIVLPGGKPVSHHHMETGEGFEIKSFRKMLKKMPAVLGITFIIFLGIGLIMSYFKLFAMDTFQISEQRYGILLLIPALIIAALSVPLGTLGDRFGKSFAIKSGIGICAFFFWLLLFFLNQYTLVVFGAFIGLGFVIAFPAWMALVSQTCPPSQRGAAIGAVGTAQGLGAILGVAVSGGLYSRPGFRFHELHIPNHGLPFVGCASMLLLAFLLTMIYIHEPVQKGN